MAVKSNNAEIVNLLLEREDLNVNELSVSNENIINIILTKKI